MIQTRRTVTPTVALFVAFVGAYALPSAQVALRLADARSGQAASRKALSADDYAKWRSIQGEQISNDGNWVTFVLQLTNVPAADAKPV